ncbi:MAG TPA: hypothetical protein VKU83_00250 [Puia sp.]|nr:hypothetical protein [Puia sp.]
MKKSILVLALAILGFAGSAFAGTKDPSVPGRITDQFSNQFAKATDVQWQMGKNFFKATFEDWGRTLFAFYAFNGDLMGVASNLSPAGLPGRLKTQLHRDFAGYWITDLFSYGNQNERGMVVTIENPDRIVVLKALGKGNWIVYRTTIKN